MALEKLFEPIRIGSVEVRNRIVFVPVNLNYTEYPHRYESRYIDALEERARGGVGLIITSHVKCETDIDPYLVSGLPSIGIDDNLKVFAELAEVVHLQGAKIAIQLSPGVGRIADKPIADKWPASASAVPMLRHPKLLTRALTQDEIAKLVRAFGIGAQRAERAGFDAIEVHCFGGLLIDQFLSPLWNRRTDEYGGSLENRMRFMVECVQSARSRVKSTFGFIARLTSSYMMEGERSIEETIRIAERLKELGVSALHLTTGGYDTLDWIMGPTYYPEGYGVEPAQKIKEAVGLPIIVDGRISDPLFAEKLLVERKVDFVGLGRALLADPEWPRKAREGRIDDIRRCQYCDECIRRAYTDKYVKCAVNPALGQERVYRVEPAQTPRKVLVVGAGPAGLQTAIRAAQRGHEVTVLEKSDKVGGNVLAAAAPGFKAPMRLLAGRLAREAEEAGVKILLRKEGTVESIGELEPDVVVVATGALPGVMTDVRGLGTNSVTAIDVLLGTAPVGREVVVIGGGAMGCEVALFLAEGNRKVTIVEMQSDIGSQLSAPQKLAMSKLLSQHGVCIITSRSISEITPQGDIVIAGKDGSKESLKADTLIVATGMVSNAGLALRLRGVVPEVYVIGDAAAPRRIFDAIHEGDSLGRRL